MADKAALRARLAARGWVTRASKKLENICQTPDVSLIELNDAIDDFDKRIASLDQCQTNVEQDIELSQLETDINEAADFREKARIPRIKAAGLLASKTPLPDIGDNLSLHSSVSVASVEAKLPKLELPTFSGDVTTWTTFWEQFQAVVHNSELPNIAKFTYLLSLLTGDAKAAVRGLALTAANYKSACDILEKRFGRPERIIFSHVQELLSINVSRQPKVSVLWKMFDDLQGHVRSLEVLGITGEQYGVVLTPLILSRLPPDLRMEWARDGEQHESDLSFLLAFLKREIERRERSQSFSKEHDLSFDGVSVLPEKVTPMATAAALRSAADVVQQNCGLCHRPGHNLDRCFTIIKTPICERREILRRAGACFRCLTVVRGHIFRNCQAKCVKCKGKHHALLCTPQSASSLNNTHSMQHTPNATVHVSDPGISIHSNVSNVNSVTGVASQVLMQAIQVSVHGKCGSTKAIVLFDTGSDKTYVSKHLVERTGPEWVGSQNLAFATFGSDRVNGAEQRNMYSIIVEGSQGNTATLLATEIPIICAPLSRPSVPHNVLASLGKDIEILDVPVGQGVRVDILVGLDTYWKLMTSEMVFLPEGLVAQRSVVGWVLSGPLPAFTVATNQFCVSHQLCCLQMSDSGLKNFWDLESVGIYDKEASTVDPVLEDFNKQIQFSDGRYMVPLPWKSEVVKSRLLSNEQMARSRLENLTRRLSKDPKLETEYSKVFCEMQQEGIIEEVPEDEICVSHPVFYMPHRPVFKENSQTTKIRPVFDASAKGFNGVSLNDCLETGPSLIPDLPGILLRFRRWKVAITADVTRAFHQVTVRPEDRDVHRFLWNDQGVVRRMRFVRVPFGNKSSPFLLNATIKHHLAKLPSSRVTEELLENMYVDDWLSGCDDSAECCDMLREADEVMNRAGMSLAKWGSNSEQVDELLSRDFVDRSVGEDSFKVLGMRWSASEDCFSFDGLVISSDMCVTKRLVLSLISRLFDPLGFLSPFVILAKCLFQELWRLGVAWDEVVPVEIQSKFVGWLKGLEFLRTWRIPRSYTGVAWHDSGVLQLHAFGDASQLAYGACVYIYVQLRDGKWKSSLVIARSKVAPLKKLSLPRLELLGALLCARLVVYVKRALGLSEDVECHCWTDSTVTLAWIQSDPHKWKPFVGNRVAELQSLISPAQWHHLPGKDNPADMVTRGIPAEELLTSRLWLQGPVFLLETADHSLKGGGTIVDRWSGSGVSNLEEARKSIVTTYQLISVCCEEANLGTSGANGEGHSLDVICWIKRWSTLVRAMRVMAWMQRFLGNSKMSQDVRKQGDLSYEELSEAKFSLVRCLQKQEFNKELQAIQSGRSVHKTSCISKLSPFIGKDGLLRVQGRLQFAGLSYESEHPIIVPKGHLGLLLARQVHVGMKHAGVNSMLVELRNQYWMVGARRTCKRVKRECTMCQRLDAPAGVQTIAPLPEMRVKQSHLFSVTGLDHCGPLYCCDSIGKKFYVLLFTCAVMRGVHLELVDSLSCAVTVLALRRFIARRGMPSILVSDNAKCFSAAKEQLLRILGPNGPEWRFIVPRAPWWGGWWERLVSSVKSALKRSLGKRSLSRVELETALHEVEACVNSRPLTFVGDELDSGAPLTPAHFLLGRSSVFTPATASDDVSVESHDLVLRHELRNQLLERFWSCWVNEYVRNLPPCKGVPANKGGVQVGSVVLVKGEGSNRLQWPLGVVQTVYPGRDGLVRSVKVRTAKGRYVRSIQCVHDLEVIDSHGVPSLDQERSPDSQDQSDQSSDLVSPVSDTANTHTLDNSCALPSSQSKVTRFGREVKRPSRLDL